MAVFDFDAYAPAQIVEKVATVGVRKARLPMFGLLLLGIIADAHIGLGALCFVLVVSDAPLSFAASGLLSGLVFSLGLVLVVLAGSELFTGNNLLVMLARTARFRPWSCCAIGRSYSGPMRSAQGALSRPIWSNTAP